MRCPACLTHQINSRIRDNLAQMHCSRCGAEWWSTYLGGRMVELPIRRTDAPHRVDDATGAISEHPNVKTLVRLARHLERGEE